MLLVVYNGQEPESGRILAGFGIYVGFLHCLYCPVCRFCIGKTFRWIGCGELRTLACKILCQVLDFQVASCLY